MVPGGRFDTSPSSVVTTTLEPAERATCSNGSYLNGCDVPNKDPIMSLHKEISFEVEICEYLAGQGWLYADQAAADYDRKLALFPADVLAWVQATQSAAWDALTKNHGAAAGDTLLRRLRQSIDQQGTLHVLRHGFDVLGLRKEI